MIIESFVAIIISKVKNFNCQRIHDRKGHRAYVTGTRLFNIYSYYITVNFDGPFIEPKGEKHNFFFLARKTGDSKKFSSTSCMSMKIQIVSSNFFLLKY